MKKITTLLFLTISITAFSQDYNVALIPDSLKENANVVKRFEEFYIVVKDIDKAVIKHKYAVTILNENGDNDAWYSNGYDKLRELSDISGNLFDKDGKKLKSVKKKDIEDAPAEDGFSLISDNRYKAHNFFYRQYPYTVEYEDEQTYNGILAFPQWRPIENLKMSVQQSRYTIEAPPDYALRYKQFNYAAQPAITNGKTKLYTWEVKNVKTFPYENFQPNVHAINPYVYAAPTEFSYGGYSGKMSSWLEYGKYQVELNKGRDELPENIKQEVHKLTDGTTDAKEKIKILYSYLQNNTRYISVQLGIGGLQPFDAKYVATKKYGDCKALSNYMHALLKEAGIKGYYTEITAGENEKFYIPDFPSFQGNHVILCVPLNKDTVWLECTDQDMAAGYLGNFTDDRYGLMIKEDGGYLVKTPKYTEKENTHISIITSAIDENGKLTAKIKTTYSGLEQDDLFSRLKHWSKEDILKQMKSEIDIPTYDIVDFKHEEHKGTIPAIDEYLNLTAENYASVSGKRIFVTPNILSKSRVKLSSAETRKYDIVKRYSFKDADTISIAIPAGYTVEAMPKNVAVSNKFGTYNISFSVEPQKISCTRLYTETEGRFPATDYPELVKFYDTMFKADHSKIVFVKKEG